jgi:hypothetical protein
MADLSASSSATSVSSSSEREASNNAHDELVRKKNTWRTWMRSPTSRPNETERRRQGLLEALTEYVHLNGGHVISPPGQKLVRIEIPPNSDLPAKLAEYQPTPCGSSMRTSYAGFEQMEIYELSLDK